MDNIVYELFGDIEYREEYLPINKRLTLDLNLYSAMILCKIVMETEVGSKWKREKDNKNWLDMSIEEMQSNFFPFFSISTIKRQLSFLVSEGYIERKATLGSNIYSVNKEKIREVLSEGDL